MTDEQFLAMASRLDVAAQARPSLYRAQVYGLAALGNVYVVLVLGALFVVILALLASLMVLKALAVKLIFVVGFFLWPLLKSLWVKAVPPVGVEVTRQQAPALFGVIDEVRRALRAPRFHHVLVCEDLNAGVVQQPRLGLFGWTRNYLVLGLPLMQALTPEQFKAVLAHEFGHLAKGHGRAANWIYRQRLRWSRLLAELDKTEGWGALLFKPFFRWFTPYFNAFSFSMARANEFAADATAARLTSARTVADALVNVDVVGRYLGERYWPGTHALADEMARPDLAPYTAFGGRVVAELDATSAETWLAAALARTAHAMETHPSLKDRLAALGQSPSLVLPAAGEAADHLFGSRLATLTQTFDARWREQIAESWEERHQSVQTDRQRLAVLNDRVAAGEALALQDAFDRARLTESVGGDADGALTQFMALQLEHPADSLVNFHLGARLLQRDEAMGCVLVEMAMAADEVTTAAGCELLRDFHWRHGREDEAHAWHARLQEHQNRSAQASEERSVVRLENVFEPHGLPAEAIARLKSELRGVKGLRRAWLVRKRVQYRPEVPCYVLGFSATGLLDFMRERQRAAVLQRLRESVNFPGETLLLGVDGGYYRFGRKLRWRRGARVR